MDDGRLEDVDNAATDILWREVGESEPEEHDQASRNLSLIGNEESEQPQEDRALVHATGAAVAILRQDTLAARAAELVGPELEFGRLAFNKRVDATRHHVEIAGLRLGEPEEWNRLPVGASLQHAVSHVLLSANLPD